MVLEWILGPHAHLINFSYRLLQVNAMLASVGDATQRIVTMASTQLPWLPIEATSAVSAWFSTPAATCISLRIVGQIGVLIGTTIILVAMEMRDRRKFAGMVGVPMPARLPAQQAAMHVVTVIVVIVLAVVVALLTAGYIRELPRDLFGALLFPISEIDGHACAV
jgi:hypothetical protein